MCWHGFWSLKWEEKKGKDECLCHLKNGESERAERESKE